MWGPSIVGFGRYRYTTPGGRESEFAMVGLSPDKKAITIYVNPDFSVIEEPLERLGKHTVGKSCLYIRELKHINLDVLEEILTLGMASMKKKFKTWDE
jgi:hypothetical protein